MTKLELTNEEREALVRVIEAAVVTRARDRPWADELQVGFVEAMGARAATRVDP